MAERPKIEIEPTVLRYARFCSGYNLDEASKKIGIKKEELYNAETEKAEMLFGTVKKISKAYKLPTVFFMLDNAPDDRLIPDDFRIVYESEEESFSPTVMLAIRRARYIQTVISDIADSDFKYEFTAATLKTDTQTLANKFRKIIGVDLDEQKKWSGHQKILKNWKEKVENIGIFILQHSIPEDSVSAFSVVDKKPYVIMLNSFEHENRRIFSLFHEIGHLFLQQSGICTPDNFSRNTHRYVQIEKFCNEFASNTLVPTFDFKDNPKVLELKDKKFEEWTYDKVRAIANQYGVSQEVIYRKFVSVGFLNNKTYEQKRGELMKGFVEYQKRKKAGGPVPQHWQILGKNGKAYSSLVLDSYKSNKITMADAADFLGTNTQHLKAVADNI